MKALKKPFRKLLHDQCNLHDRVNWLRFELDEVQKAIDLDPSNCLLRDGEAAYIQAFNEAKIDEERFLKQKEKIEWLASNSAYFHKSIKIQNQRSQIDVIHSADNVEVTGNFVPEVTNEEIKHPMFDIGDDKASSPDGYTSAFLKKGWDVVEVVSENQSAFVLGRRISDNIILTQVLMHNYQRDRGPPSFHQTMIKWIMASVTSPSFSISINGGIHGRVRLSDSFRYHKQCEELQIINVCFANDLFLFARGDVDSAKVIMDSLNEFKQVSGLVPSIPKSMAFFCNVLNHVKIAILNIMPFFEGELPVKYLGVPLISSRLLNKDCKVLVEKDQNRIGD
ncbi:hypothetical protein Tco_0295733 [Tanacetum coccineum]